jgi:hypothetical protein
MRNEVRTGLGVLAVAALFAVLWAATDSPILRLGTVLFALIGLGLLAYGLLSGQNGQRPAE